MPVLGHSVGEVAAAYAAGAFDLEQAVRVIHERSAAQGLTRGHGRMAAVGLALAEALAEIARYDTEIEVAAVNSPASVTLSGPLPALEQMKARFDRRGVFCRILDLDYAFHSRTMDRVREPLLQSLAGLEPAPLSRPFVSTVTGTMLEGKCWVPNTGGKTSARQCDSTRQWRPSSSRVAASFSRSGRTPSCRTICRRTSARPSHPAALLPRSSAMRTTS